MPSTLFHVAVGLLIGAAILGDTFDRRALVAVAVAAMLPDLDSFLALWFPGAHRAYLHNVFVFLLPAAALLLLHRSAMMDRARQWWPGVGQVLWTCVIVIAVAGIGLDALGSGVNLFFPVQDQYYHVTGNVMYSSQDGFRQTLLDVDRARIGSSETMYYATAIDTAPGPDPQHAERTVPVFENGLQVLMSLTAFAVVGYRIRRRRDASFVAASWMSPQNMVIRQSRPRRQV